MTNTYAGYLEASLAGNLPVKKPRAIRQPCISGLLRALLAHHFGLLQGPLNRDLRRLFSGHLGAQMGRFTDSMDAKPVPAYVGFA